MKYLSIHVYFNTFAVFNTVVYYSILLHFKPQWPLFDRKLPKVPLRKYQQHIL